MYPGPKLLGLGPLVYMVGFPKIRPMDPNIDPKDPNDVYDPLYTGPPQKVPLILGNPGLWDYMDPSGKP